MHNWSLALSGKWNNLDLKLMPSYSLPFFKFSSGELIVLFLVCELNSRNAHRTSHSVWHQPVMWHFALPIAEPLHIHIHCFLINSHHSRKTFNSMANIRCRIRRVQYLLSDSKKKKKLWANTIGRWLGKCQNLNECRVRIDSDDWKWKLDDTAEVKDVRR